MRYLSYLGTTVGFEVAPAAAADFEPVLDFFRHSLGDTPRHEPQFVFAVSPRGDVCVDSGRAERMTIRRSSTPEFTFTADRVRGGESILYANESATVRLPRKLRPVGNRVEVGVTAGAVVQMIDLVRDLVTRHEEARGTIILHASGVVHGDQVIAIAGGKGAGKTTLLLRLLAGGKVSYFTGDKLFCRVVDGRLRAMPWRDWPYVGVGTLRASPLRGALADDLGLELDGRSGNEKLLLDPDRFERALGARFEMVEREVGAVVLPQVEAGRRTVTAVVDDPGERLARMLQLIDRSCDTSYFAWQSLLVPDYSRVYASVAAAREVLSGPRMVTAEGDLDLTIEDLVDAG